MTRPLFYIGIDPGTKTGLCVWDPQRKEIKIIMTTTILMAIKEVMFFVTQYHGRIHVRFEDARKLKLPRQLQKHGIEASQGVGSVKRDCAIWQEFLVSTGTSYEAVDPRTTRKKIKEDLFYKITNYKGRVSQHARDAAMLVFGI